MVGGRSSSWFVDLVELGSGVGRFFRPGRDVAAEVPVVFFCVLVAWSRMAVVKAADTCRVGTVGW